MQPENKTKIGKELQQVLKDNTEKYEKVYQFSLYSQLKHIEKQQIFTKSSHDVSLNIVFCFNGANYNSNHKQDILYYVIRTIEDELTKLKNQFSIAYIYESLSDFLQFRKILHYFPEKFVRKLKHIYLVKPGFIAKIIQKLSFGQYNNFIYENSIYVDSIQQIQALNKVSFQNNLKQQNQSVPMLKSAQVHVIENKLYGKKLSGYQLSQNQIPIIMQNLIIRLYSSQKFLQAEGIMRKSCDIEQLQVLEKHLMEDVYPAQYLKRLDDPYILCGCLKKILNNLFTPLFSYSLYDSVIAYRSTGKEDHDVDFVRSCLLKMQEINLNVLLYLISFLKRGIVTFMEKNKMSPYNLAVVFGPCLFRPKEYRLQDLMNSGKCSKIVMILIDNFEKIVGEERATHFYSLLEEQAKVYRRSK